jgi:hypothetical protein
MELNNETVSLMADYLTKVGSVCGESHQILQAYDQLIEQESSVKTASAQSLQGYANELAEKLGSIRLMDGRPLLEGYAMKKEAADMFADSNRSLQFMETILDVLQEDRTKRREKTGSLEPGSPWGDSGTGTQELSALEELAAECNVSGIKC